MASRRGGTAVASSSSVTSINLTIPSNVVVGDIAYIATGYNPSTEHTPTPTGWTLVDTQNFSATFSARLFSRVIQAGDASATVTLTNSLPGGQRLGAAMEVVAGVSAQDATGLAAHVDASATATHTGASATMAAAGVSLVLFVERSSTPSASALPPSGYSAAFSAFATGSGAVSAAVADKMTTVSGGATIGGDSWTTYQSDGFTTNATAGIKWVVGLNEPSTAQVGKDLGLVFHTRTSAGKDLSTPFHTRESVGGGWTRDVSDLFNVAGFTARYDILDGPASVGRDLTLRYNVAALVPEPVGADLTLRFHTSVNPAGVVSKTLDLRWNVLVNPTTTGSNLVDRVLSNLHSYTGIQEQTTYLKASMDAAQTELSVAHTDRVTQGLIEVDDELMHVSDVGDTNVVLMPFGRGMQGSTPVAHSVNCRVTNDPMIPRIKVFEAVQQTIRELKDYLFVVKTATFTYSPAQSTYDLPAGAQRVLRVHYQTIGPSQDWNAVRAWSFDANSTVSTGKAITLRGWVDPGRTVQVEYAASLPVPSGTGVDLDLLGITPETQEVVIYGACWRLLQFLEPQRLALNSVESLTQAQFVRPGDAMKASQQMGQMYLLRRDEERRRLLDLHPPTIHYTGRR